jgi:hypothetical protein
MLSRKYECKATCSVTVSKIIILVIFLKSRSRKVVNTSEVPELHSPGSPDVFTTFLLLLCLYFKKYNYFSAHPVPESYGTGPGLLLPSSLQERRCRRLASPCSRIAPQGCSQHSPCCSQGSWGGFSLLSSKATVISLRVDEVGNIRRSFP